MCSWTNVQSQTQLNPMLVIFNESIIEAEKEKKSECEINQNSIIIRIEKWRRCLKIEGYNLIIFEIEQ